MALVSRLQPSALVSNGLSTATVALNVAGAATDAVPIAKQILNSAAHISAFAERIHKKREAMYALIRKVETYSTQIDIAVAGRVLDPRLRHRLARLLSVFVKIEALVEEKAARKKYPVRVWNKFVAKPNRAEELASELDQEMTLFNLLTGIQLSLTVDDTARAVAEDARYDGQFRRLRDCDVTKLDVIHKRKTNAEVVVWSSARVDDQLMVVRHVEPLTPRENGQVAVAWSRQKSLSASYNEFLKNIEKVSTISGSHRYIVQLYGRHVRGPEAAFKSGTMDLDFYLACMGAEDTDGQDVAVKRLRLAYKVLVRATGCLGDYLSHALKDASAHLAYVHGLRWVGDTAIIDEDGEPRIGLFDDIVRADPDQSPSIQLWIYYNIFIWSISSTSKETGVVEQVHDSSLHAIITEQLRDGNDTDRLQRVWDIIRQEQLHVEYHKGVFPIISGNLSLSRELITRARLYVKTSMHKDIALWACEVSSSFVRRVLAGGDADISSLIYVWIWRFGEEYIIEADTCTHDDIHIRYMHFSIHIPIGCPLLAEVARATGLPDDSEHSWDGSRVYIYPKLETKGDQTEGENEIGDDENADNDPGESDGRDSSEVEEDEEYETADEGETSLDADGEES